MVNLRTILTPDQKRALANIIAIAEEAKQIANAAGKCEMDCADWSTVAATIQRKAKLMQEQFGDLEE